VINGRRAVFISQLLLWSEEGGGPSTLMIAPMLRRASEVVKTPGTSARGTRTAFVDERIGAVFRPRVADGGPRS